MKTIGIDIDKKKAICVALEKDNDGNFHNITGSKKYFEVTDDRDANELRDFMSQLHSYFDSINPDKMAIVTRQTKGRFSASPFSFKLEGLIQLYSKEIEFITPQALNSYYKKNELKLQPDFSYQEKAMKLADFLVNK
jgi:hypothetical protein